MRKTEPGEIFVCDDPADMVNHPPHFNIYDMGCIDIMEKMSTIEQFQGHLRCQIIKYIYRYQHKGRPCEDMKKCMWYVEKLCDDVIKRGTMTPKS